MTQEMPYPKPLRLAGGIDVKQLRRDFLKDGHVRIEPFLHPDDANILRLALLARKDWRLVLNSGDKVFELDADMLRNMGRDHRAALDKAVLESSRYEFQYRYCSIRVPDFFEDTLCTGDVLMQFVAFLRSESVLKLVRTTIGMQQIAFADGQATRYDVGHFLTAHDDAVEGKHRHAAYVMGLTDNWRAEWGGLLLFHEGRDQLAGRRPAFNSLDLFKVPSVHSVSFVNPSAASSRLSVTGWFRSYS
ncbi:2OG-Fe(II) oxygenase [Sphingobium lactosutens]|uniref:Prolyl 3,4-dihydroxylase TPA1/OFD1 N-terminal domain-containing protein n=1 Tax=Sphingobium lactosutens DS20 TaxID=1331060 RepID=T0HPD1_9SPHN|nr:2OG-Fe(II) oxygenase family protein [Sphingobium lactosutens]EQB14038.1 hypothetical protein RLDS_14015 [Sphingobium lactosutens DS20]